MFIQRPTIGGIAVIPFPYNFITLRFLNSTNMRISHYLMAIAAGSLLVFTSCGGNSGSDTDINEAKQSDELKYVSLKNADTILPEWSKENVVVVQVVGDPDNLHPTNGVQAARSWIFQYTSNAVMRTDMMNLSIAPDLAVAMPTISEDKLSFTYTLRKDATWDDGSHITAEDAVFMIKANICPLTANNAIKTYFANIQSVTIDPKDPYTFTVKLAREEYINTVLLGDFSVMQRSYFDPENVLAGYTIEQLNALGASAEQDAKLAAWANNFNDPKYGNDLSLLNGSGPYDVIEWERGSTLVLQRKKNHWSFKLESPNAYLTSYPDKIIFKVLKEPNTQKLELLAQHIDVAPWMATKEVKELMEIPEFNKNYDVQFIDNYSYNYIGLNMRPDGTMRKKIFDDVRVRKAMAMLVPIEEFIQTHAYGYAKRQAAMVSPLKAEYNSDLKLIGYDIEAAKRLLDEAGWIDSDGDNIRDKKINNVKTDLRIELKHQAGQKFVEEQALIIKENAYKAGIDIVIVPVDNIALREQISTHDFDMFMSALSGGALPDDYTQLWHTKSYATEGGMNYVGFGNAASDALIDSIRFTMDTDKRIEMIKRLQKMVYDEQPFIFLYSPSKKVIMHKRFTNRFIAFERPNVILNNMRLLTPADLPKKDQ